MKSSERSVQNPDSKQQQQQEKKKNPEKLKDSTKSKISKDF